MDRLLEEQVKRILDKSESLNIPLGKTVDTKIVEEFEKEYSIVFPESYKVFITQVENGGPGPYYGIYSLETSLEIAGQTYSDLKIENLYEKDFDFSLSEKERFTDKDWEEKIGESLNTFFQGGMEICEYGCGDFYRLIITGKEAGKIWNYSYTDTGLFNLNVTILTFFENWLDREMDKMRNPEKKFNAEYSCLEFGNNSNYKLV